jgi:hypothetical protein
MEPLSLIFLLPKILIRNMMCQKKNKKLEDLAFLIVKNHLPMHFVESQWLVKFILHLCPRVVLHFKKYVAK